MSKDTITVNMNVCDIPIVVEQLNKLEQENQQLKELEKEHQKINGELREENKKLKKQLEAKDNIQITFQQLVEKKGNQEVKFVKYLNNCIKELQKESTNKLQNTINLGIADVTKEILSKYKEIIGVEKDLLQILDKGVKDE